MSLSPLALGHLLCQSLQRSPLRAALQVSSTVPVVQVGAGGTGRDIWLDRELLDPIYTTPILLLGLKRSWSMGEALTLNLMNCKTWALQNPDLNENFTTCTHLCLKSFN